MAHIILFVFLVYHLVFENSLHSVVKITNYRVVLRKMFSCFKHMVICFSLYSLQELFRLYDTFHSSKYRQPLAKTSHVSATLYFIDFNHTCGCLIIPNDAKGELSNLKYKVVVPSSNSLASSNFCKLNILCVYRLEQ